VRVRVTGREKFSSLEAKDISRGGMFLAMANPLPAGTRVSIELTHSGGYTMMVPGEVVRSIAPGHIGPEGSGVGVRIGPLSEAEQVILDVFVEETGTAPAAAQPIEPAPTADVIEPPQSMPEAIEQCRVRLAEGPIHHFFGLGENAAPAAKRLAYQARVKQWHPSNFLDESRDVLEAATGLCRNIRSAYEEWVKGDAN